MARIDPDAIGHRDLADDRTQWLPAAFEVVSVTRVVMRLDRKRARCVAERQSIDRICGRLDGVGGNGHRCKIAGARGRIEAQFDIELRDRACGIGDGGKFDIELGGRRLRSGQRLAGDASRKQQRAEISHSIAARFAVQHHSRGPWLSGPIGRFASIMRPACMIRRMIVR
ncbi:hypothetical protein WBP07_25015 [Novosphingobium sp. BL-8A]|uniref:hypothetical protein n=1 Tax=Novosphingobium sp. BL-8A TaxID=3127639 RepID=UPI003756E5EB